MTYFVPYWDTGDPEKVLRVQWNIPGTEKTWVLIIVDHVPGSGTGYVYVTDDPGKAIAKAIEVAETTGRKPSVMTVKAGSPEEALKKHFKVRYELTDPETGKVYFGERI